MAPRILSASDIQSATFGQLQHQRVEIQLRNARRLDLYLANLCCGDIPTRHGAPLTTLVVNESGVLKMDDL